MIFVTTLPIEQPVPGAHEVTVCILVEVIVSVTVEAPNVADDIEDSPVVEVDENLDAEGVVIGYGGVMLALNPPVEFPGTMG